MIRGRTMMRGVMLASGIGLVWSMTGPASAQFECPPGYYYVPGYDCQLPNTPYAVPDYYYYSQPIQQFHRWGDDHRNDWHVEFGHGAFGHGDFGRGDSGHGDSERGAGSGHR